MLNTSFLEFSATITKAPCLSLLCKELKPMSKQWRDIGDLLDLTEEDLDKVESQYGSSHAMCMKKMFQVWLRRGEPPPTWDAIFNALNYMDSDLAPKIKQKYLA